jgi:hypothetical protein
LRGIGNIYPTSTTDSLTKENKYDVERIVSMQFFWGDHIHQDVARGPFRSSKDWINSRLAFHENDCKKSIAIYNEKGDLNSDGDEYLEDAQRTLKILEKLKPIIEQLFPDNSDFPEPSILFHDDISKHNILVSEDGQLAGVIDWECVSVLPLWKACECPAFLLSRPRDKEPDRSRYWHDENGDPDDLYWDHLMNYEQTKLRHYFLEEMRRLESLWMDVYESSQLQRDFEVALQSCDDEFRAKDISAWVEDVISGKPEIPSLSSRFYR